MGYKTILVHCDATRGTTARLAVGRDLARRFGAHLVGLHVRQPFQAPMFSDAISALDALYATYAKTARADEAESKAVFDGAMAGGETSSEWRAVDGMVEDALIQAARFADLVVVGQYDPEAPASVSPSDLVERVAMAGERPSLIVPYIGAARTPGEHVMVCWNGSREAVRAITGSLPFLKKAGKVSLLMVDAQKMSAAPEPGADAVRWLERHGVKVAVHHDSSDGSDIGGVLLSRSADLGVDLIVMGLYGHSRMRELVLGGASRTLLASMTVPLLAAH
jgi:nucleotide-binding universal stress UspA family protein